VAGRGAARHIHPDQLRMLMPAGELAQFGANPFDRRGTEGGRDVTHSHETTWSVKLDEASDDNPDTGRNLMRDIKSQGVQKPVNVYHLSQGEDPNYVVDMDDESGKEVSVPVRDKTIANGQHRVAAASFLNPDMMVPVQHYDQTSVDATQQSPLLHAATDGQDPKGGPEKKRPTSTADILGNMGIFRK